MAKTTSPTQRADKPPESPTPVKPVPPPAPESTSQDPARAASHFFRDFLIAGVLGVAILGAYWKHNQTVTTVNHVDKKAKDLIERDTPADFYKAEEQLKKALELDSSNAYSLSALAEINALLWGEDGVTDRKSQAEDFARKADSVDPHIAERYSADALILLYNGQATQAETSIRAVLDKGAKGARLYDVLGRALRAQGKLEDAKKALMDASKLGRIPRFNVDLAEVFYDQGDLVQADTYIQKALESNPEHPRALAMRARLSIARGLNIKVATDDLASLLGPRKSELTPALLAQAYAARAQLKLFNHQPAEAVRDAQEAVKANPKLAIAHQVLGLALVQANNIGQALNEFDRAKALDPAGDAFYFEAARALAQAKEVDKAMAILKKVPVKDEQYHLAFGDLLRKKGDLAAALAEFDEALKLNSFSAPAFYGKGLVFADQKKIPEAGKAFEAAYGARPNYPEAHQQMGNLLVDAKKGEDAASEYEQSLTMYVEAGTPRERLLALRDDFIGRLKKGAPKIVSKFQDDCKQILH